MTFKPEETVAPPMYWSGTTVKPRRISLTPGALLWWAIKNYHMDTKAGQMLAKSNSPETLTAMARELLGRRSPCSKYQQSVCLRVIGLPCVTCGAVATRITGITGWCERHVPRTAMATSQGFLDRRAEDWDAHVANAKRRISDPRR